jgi:hypothetical protein
MSAQMARVIRLPRTSAGRELLREAAITIGGWGNPGGAELEAFDWDASAVLDQEMGLPAIARRNRDG